jgi:hypothetical protein
LDVFFKPLLELFFPQAARNIDWSVPPEFLDTELQKIAADAGLGKQYVDRLIKVQRIDGTGEWVLLHLEVQAQPDTELAKRVYQYHHRLVDLHLHPVATMVVLADDRASWRPNFYETELWGCRLRFEYPVCKLLDLAPDVDRLEASGNPAAVMVAAHLATQATYEKMDVRKEVKLRLSQRLYRPEYSDAEIRALLSLIDWLMRLSPEMEPEFRREMKQFEEEKAMRHISSFEQAGIEIGLEKGREQGREEGRQEEAAGLLVRQAHKRFHTLSAEDESRIRQLPLPVLESLSEALLDFAGIEDLRQWLSAQNTPAAT